MPLFTPSRRWQQAYYPFKKRSYAQRLEESLERTFKGILWGCRMCGNCLLQETAFICPMACPKGLRNGSCGGSTPEHCCVDESRPCIWYEIYARAEKMGRLDKLMEVLPPLDWDKTGTSALQDVYSKVKEKGMGNIVSSAIVSSPEELKYKWDQFFKEIRQPDWWDGDSQPHPQPAHKPISELEHHLTAGNFVVTCEDVPPSSGNFARLDQELLEIKDLVDAVNITDSASAIPQVSPYACAVRASELGIEPVLQIAARDRTRLSFQADLMGASASGIRNILLISGDHPNKGNPPFSKMDIWDFDSVQAIWIARKLRDEGTFLDGREVTHPPGFFIGAALSPFGSKPEYEAMRAEKKLNAGAQYFQTNLIFDIDRFETYLEALDARNLLPRMNLIAGVTPIRSLMAINYLQKLPGIVIPDSLIHRLESAKDFKEEAHQFSLELIDKLKSMPGVHGIHIMAISNTENLKRLLSDSGLTRNSVPHSSTENEAYHPGRE